MVDTSKRLDPKEARKLLGQILQKGVVHFSHHALAELAHDDLTEGDALGVLRRGKITEAPELARGSWRYRLHTENVGVVVAFADASRAVVVTAWRKR